MHLTLNFCSNSSSCMLSLSCCLSFLLQRGKYDTPKWVSAGSAELISQLLVVSALSQCVELLQRLQYLVFLKLECWYHSYGTDRNHGYCTCIHFPMLLSNFCSSGLSASQRLPFQISWKFSFRMWYEVTASWFSPSLGFPPGVYVLVVSWESPVYMILIL